MLRESWLVVGGLAAFGRGQEMILPRILHCGIPGFDPWVGKIPRRRDWLPIPVLGFPGGSDGKESACNAGDPGSIPGLGRSPGEGYGNPLQYSWDSLVAQLVKNLPVMQDTPV